MPASEANQNQFLVISSLFVRMRRKITIATTKTIQLPNIAVEISAKKAAITIL
jgi:hypothetical protein